MYIHIYIYIYIHICIYIYIYIFICIEICTQICTHIYSQIEPRHSAVKWRRNVLFKSKIVSRNVSLSLLVSSKHMAYVDKTGTKHIVCDCVPRALQ